LDLRGRKWQEVGEDCIMRSFITLACISKYYGNQIKEGETSRACSRHGKTWAYIRMDFRERGWCVLDPSGSGQGPVAGSHKLVMYLQVP
jgi:hypothetical protein